jgi:xanthine dehydrogenase YagR molybdenum-binding subunit
MTTSYIGQPQSRVDGRAKFTGAAKYAAEHRAPLLLHGVVVASTIAKGTIEKIDISDALALEGVVHVFTHENRRNTAWFDLQYKDMAAPPAGSPFRPLRDKRILHNDQPLALVVAESAELARYAARLVRVEYEAEQHETALAAKLDAAHRTKWRPLVQSPAKPRGDAEGALASAEVRHEAEYIQPFEHHNPLEMHASTVIHEADGSMTIYDKTQGAHNSKLYVANVFGLSRRKVRVVSPFVGGAFGSALRPQYQLFLAVMAALELKRSVRVEMTRREMFSFAHRPHTIQKLSLGASSDGKLQAIKHEAITNTSTFEDYSENIVNWSGMLYQCENVTLEHKAVQLDLPTPGDMRAPGAPTGLWALESALDELACKLNIDPLELRLRNYAEREQNLDKPFSSKELRACYQQAAEAFGWARRTPAPRSMRAGRELIGWGMATGVWEALYEPTAAKAVLTADGQLVVSSGTADIGTGTYTIMAQIAAETLGLPLGSVTFVLGDTTLPLAPIEGGSMTAASCGSAVKEACEAVRKQLFALARKLPDSPFAGAKLADAIFADGDIVLRGDATRRMAITRAMRRSETGVIEESTTSLRTFAAQSLKQKDYARNSHSAIFVEVRVDADLGTIRVARVVSAIAGGRILNPKTARSQILGGVVWGIGMALGEETVIDQQFGRFMNANLGEYHVPVNADVPEIEVIFVEERDEIVNPLGVKGLGEIGIVGVAPAIANAIHHATGVRVRELPIRLDALLG